MDSPLYKEFNEVKNMKQFECIEDKRIYTESQLQQLFQFKVVH